MLRQEVTIKGTISFNSGGYLYFPRMPIYYWISIDLQGSTVVKNLPASAGDTRDAGSVPGQEDSLK